MTAREEGELRIRLAFVLKAREQFTAALAQWEKLIAIPNLPDDLMRRAWSSMVSVNAEIGRLDRVEQLAGNDPARLAYLTIGYFDARLAERGHATLEKEIALAEHTDDRLRLLCKQSERAIWRVISPRRDRVTSQMIAASLSDLDACEAALASIDDDIARRAVERIRTWRPIVQNADKLGRAADDLRAVAIDPRQSDTERAMASRLLLVSLLKRNSVVSLTAARVLAEEIFPFLLSAEPARGLASAAYVAALIECRLGRLQNEPKLFHSAMSWLEHAARWLSHSRREHHEPGLEETDESRRALDIDAPKIHALAVEILMKDLRMFSAAFEWVERSKAGVLAEVLGTTSLPAPVGLPPTLLAEESRALDALKQAADYSDVSSAHDALGLVWNELAGIPNGAEYVAIRRGTPMSFHEVRDMLSVADGELAATQPRRLVLIEYAVMGDQLLAFEVSSDDDVAAVKLIPVSVSALQRDLNAAVGAPDDLLAQRIAALVTSPSVALCVEPIVAWTNPEDVVCIVPAGPLFQLPFHAVAVGGTPLMQRNAIFYAPSATTLRACMARRTAGHLVRAAAVFGDPDGDLPDARVEATAVAQLLGVEPMFGDEVTADVLLHAASTKEVVHYCGHAFFDSDDAFASGLYTAEQGVVTARQFLNSPGTMRLMALSGCSTGRNDVRPGDELLGFTRAMLYAGAASLLVTLWPIDDDASAALMAAFYDRWLNRGQPKVQALRDAQCDAIAAGFTEPNQWAPFTLVGDWK